MDQYASAPVVFWLTFAIMTLFLLWLTSRVMRELAQPNAAGRANLRAMLSEKEPVGARQAGVREGDTQPVGDISFSRVCGAVGMAVLTAFFVGVSYYSLWALFGGQEDLSERIKDLGYVFLSGSALFAPYAFNRLSQIFK